MGKKGKRKRTNGNTDKSKTNQNTSATSVSKEEPDVKNNVSDLNLNRDKIDVASATNEAADIKKSNASDAEMHSENEHCMENQLKETNSVEVTSHHRKEYNDRDKPRLIRDSGNTEYGSNSMSKDCEMPEQDDWWEQGEQSHSANQNRWSLQSSKSSHNRSNSKYKSYGHEKSSNLSPDLNDGARNRENQKKHTSKEGQKLHDECRPNEGNQRYSSKIYKNQSAESNEKSKSWRSEQKEADEYNKHKSQNEGNQFYSHKNVKKEQFGRPGERSDDRRSNRRNEADEYNRNKFRNSSKDRPRAEGFDEFNAFYKSNKDLQYRKVHEVDGDLFTAGSDYSLGHCVAEDMKMGSGIAVSFRRDFKRVDELLSQRKTQGNVAILEDQGRYIYYLVTKRESSKKPTYLNLWLSLQKMKDHIIANSVKKLALPRIGCGLDSLEWHEVKAMLEYTFDDVDIEIKIYNFQQGITKRGFENFNANVQLQESIEHDILKSAEMSVSRKSMTDVNDLLLETKCTLTEEEDQYDVFGRYIVSQMKCLSSEDRKKEMKKKIEQILLEMREEKKIVIKDPDASPVSRPRKCWVVNHPKPLSEIESGTIMIYFLSEDGHETDEIKSLYNKFPFLRFSVQDSSSKTLGKYVNIQRSYYNFYGCIVRKSHKDLFSFQDFQKCLNSIQTRNRKDKYDYIAFQAFLEDGSDLIVEKIVNLISHSMTQVHVYVCWPEDLLKFMPYQHSDKSTA